MHGDDDAWYRLPDSPELAAQYMLMYEMSLPPGLDLSHQVTLDKSATRLTVSAKEVRSATVLKLTDDIEVWFAENAPQYRVVATGLVKLMSEVTMYELIPKMARGAFIAILMVSLVLFFALRSWLLGLFGMFANVIPIAVGYGLWALSGQLYNFVVISVAGICLGMVVDFAVHFLDKFRSAYQRENDVELAIHDAFNKVASPITITAVVLMAGFYVLSFTKTATFMGLGLLTPMIIFLALLFDLIVLPALLMAIYKPRKR
jgi:predicted RND superfamily exporter protein